jgi:hypothetical protein
MKAVLVLIFMFNNEAPVMRTIEMPTLDGCNIAAETSTRMIKVYHDKSSGYEKLIAYCVEKK